jgi:hypothetical protein
MIGSVEAVLRADASPDADSIDDGGDGKKGHQNGKRPISNQKICRLSTLAIHVGDDPSTRLAARVREPAAEIAARRLTWCVQNGWESWGRASILNQSCARPVNCRP